MQGWPKLSCNQFPQCPWLPVHYTPLATVSAPIYLSLPTRAGAKSHSKPAGIAAAAPTAQVQRLNNQKHVQYINISADNNLCMRKRGLHKGLGTEDVTSDRAGGNRQAFNWSGGANGSHSSSSSFVLGGVIRPTALSALRASITHLTSGLEQGVIAQRQTTRDWLSLKRNTGWRKNGGWTGVLDKQS